MSYAAVKRAAEYHDQVFAFKAEKPPAPEISTSTARFVYACRSCSRRLVKTPCGEHGLGTWPKCCGDRKVRRS